MGDEKTSQMVDLAELKWVAAEASPTERVALRPDTVSALIASLEKAEAENARLREVLRPFAEAAEYYDDANFEDHFWPDSMGGDEVTIGHFRRARAIITNPVQGD